MSATLWISGVALLAVIAGWRLSRAVRTLRRILSEEIDHAEPELPVSDATPRG